MPQVAVVTDSACDLPEETRLEHGIQVVPLTVRFGTEEFLECNLPREQFWLKARQAPPYPGTSQPSVGQFEQAFSELVDQGKQVVCLTVTSKHSGTFNSASTAALEFPGDVRAFDTLSLSLAQGYMAMRAAEAAAAGDSLEDVCSLLESLRERTHFFFMLDTIEYLRRGGRADRVMPLLERIVRMLSIKPILKFVDGEISPLGASRSQEKAKTRILQELSQLAPAEMVFGIYTQGAGAGARDLAQSLAEKLQFPFEQTMIGEAGPVLSCHAGPGVIAAAVVQRAP